MLVYFSPQTLLTLLAPPGDISQQPRPHKAGRHQLSRGPNARVGYVVECQEEGVSAIPRDYRPYHPCGDVTPKILPLDTETGHLEAPGLQ
jgi:hypothetical protein